MTRVGGGGVNTSTGGGGWGAGQYSPLAGHPSPQKSSIDAPPTPKYSQHPSMPHWHQGVVHRAHASVGLAGSPVGQINFSTIVLRPLGMTARVGKINKPPQTRHQTRKGLLSFRGILGGSKSQPMSGKPAVKVARGACAAQILPEGHLPLKTDYNHLFENSRGNL